MFCEAVIAVGAKEMSMPLNWAQFVPRRAIGVEQNIPGIRFCGLSLCSSHSRRVRQRVLDYKGKREEASRQRQH